MRRRLEHSVNNPMFGEGFLECENEKNAQRRLWRAQEHGQRFGPCVARWQIDRGLRASLTRAAPSTRCASAATPRGGWHADKPNRVSDANSSVASRLTGDCLLRERNRADVGGEGGGIAAAMASGGLLAGSQLAAALFRRLRVTRPVDLGCRRITELCAATLRWEFDPAYLIN